MRRIQDSPFVYHTDAVRGFIFDVETGLLEEVLADDEPTGQGKPVESTADAD
jgi:carbonic anhydrase